MSAAWRASAMAPRDGLDTTPTAGMWRAGSSGQRVLITHLRVVTGGRDFAAHAGDLDEAFPRQGAFRDRPLGHLRICW